MSYDKPSDSDVTIVANHNPALYAVVLWYLGDEIDDDLDNEFDGIVEDVAPIVAWRIHEDRLMEPITYNFNVNEAFGLDSTTRRYHDLLLWDKSTDKLTSFSGDDIFDSLQDAKASCFRWGRDQLSKLRTVA